MKITHDERGTQVLLHPQELESGVEFYFDEKTGEVLGFRVNSETLGKPCSYSFETLDMAMAQSLYDLWQMMEVGV